MKPTLVILAAGMATRYGSMKQVDGFGPGGETIIEYSIFDAIKAGFGKVIFIIKEEFLDTFKNLFEPKLKNKIDVDYAFQDFDLQKFGVNLNIHREKPWGTAHAMICAENQIKEPFCIINADDFYGREAFEKMHQFLSQESNGENFALMGYEVEKTLSDFGTVSRGICEVNAGNLVAIEERTKVRKNKQGIVYEDDNGEFHLLSDASRASMNFWGFTPEVFDVSKSLFKDFALKHQNKPKAEFFLPLVADYLVKHQKAKFKVIPTASKWFGVTYKEDKIIVKQSLSELIENGIYPSSLWN